MLLTFSALVLTGCFEQPKLRSCAEFPIGTAPDVCGSGCEIYCNTVVESCPESYSSVGSCKADCLETPFSNGSLGDDRGDSLECRITHAQRSETDSCQAASLLSSGLCTDGGDCPGYCALMAANCAEAYPSTENCEDSCTVFAASDDTTGNTLACRFAAAEAAAGDSTQCLAASLSGGGICGADVCETYCDLSEQNCADAPIYSSREQCKSACALMALGGIEDWRTEADSLQCRTYHLGAPAKADPVKHCPHGQLFNAAHCGDRCEIHCRLLNLSVCEVEVDTCLADCAAAADTATLFPDNDVSQGCEMAILE